MTGRQPVLRWEAEPWRMVQMKLREPDMEDISAKRSMKELQAFHAKPAMKRHACTHCAM